jgi:diacylglycerol kinase (ATP)
MEALIAAFGNSMRGLAHAFRFERAVRQELVTLAIAIPMALAISQHIWVRVGLIGVLLVTLAVELLNTAIEKLCNHVTPDRHPTIGIVKDLGSAVVLCMLVPTAVVWSGALLEYAGF